MCKYRVAAASKSASVHRSLPQSGELWFNSLNTLNEEFPRPAMQPCLLVFHSVSNVLSRALESCVIIPILQHFA